MEETAETGRRAKSLRLGRERQRALIEFDRGPGEQGENEDDESEDDREWKDGDALSCTSIRVFESCTSRRAITSQNEKEFDNSCLTAETSQSDCERKLIASRRAISLASDNAAQRK